MAGAFQSKPSRGGSTSSSKSTKAAADPPKNGHRKLNTQNTHKLEPSGHQPHPADEIVTPVSSLPATAPSGILGFFHQRLGIGQASLPQPKHNSHLESSNHRLPVASGKDQPAVEEDFTEGPGDSLNGRTCSHDPKRLLRDTPTSDSATCSASKSPSATPDHRHQAANGLGQRAEPSSGLSRAQSGISNLRLPDGNVLEEGPLEARLPPDSISSESAASGDSPPPQPNTPRHGPNDSPIAAMNADSEYGLIPQLDQLETETCKEAVQTIEFPESALQDRSGSDGDKAAIMAGPASPLEERGQPREIDQTPKAEAIVDLFQSFLYRIGFDKEAISIQVNSHPQWHGLPQVQAPAVVESHVPGLGVLSFQHRSGPF